MTTADDGSLGDEFLREWTEGEFGVNIELFLRAHPQPDGSRERELLLTLIEADFEQRLCGRGLHRVEDYLERFATLRSDAEALFRLYVVEWEHLRAPRQTLAEYLRQRPFCVPGYTILGVLGRGGMGVVYRARQLSLDRIVALKMIRVVEEGEHGVRAIPQEQLTQTLNRFPIEMEAIARLNHPNVVQVYDSGIFGSQPFCVMECVEGGTLASRLGDNLRLAPLLVARLLKTLALAIAHAHEQGVIHRDLKPVNVLLAGRPDGPVEECVPKIADFGLAKFLDDSGPELTASTAQLGTPAYMAPEQASKRSREAREPADVWALGVMLYRCLTGVLPFRGATNVQTLDLICNHEPIAPRKLVPGLPRDLETICLKCLQKEPQRRYASAAELAADLHRFLENEPILARPTSVPERVWLWARRRPVTALLLVALVLSLVGGSAFSICFGLQAHAEAVAARAAEAETLREARARSKGDAENAALEGDHRLTVSILDKLLEPGAEPHDLELRLTRLRALVALGDRDRVKKELEQLLTDPTAESHRPSLWLYQGDLLLTEPGGWEEGIRTINAALVASHKLRPEDREYALGVLAESTETAVQHFEAAVRQYRRHVRAASALVVLYSVCGRLDEAERQAELLRADFREMPLSHFVAAWVDLLRGRPEEARIKLGNLDALMGAEQANKVRQFFKVAGNVLEINQTVHRLPDADLPKTLVELAFQMNELTVLAHEALAPMGLAMPSLVRVWQNWDELILAWGEHLEGQGAKPEVKASKWAAALKRIQRAAAAHPDVVLSHLVAFEQMMIFHERQKVTVRATPEAARLAAELAEAADAAYQAADNGWTVLPKAPWRYRLRWLGVILDMMHLGTVEQPLNSERQKTADRNLRLLLATDPEFLKDRTLPLTETVQIVLRGFLDAGVVRAHLTCWEKDEPENPQPVYWRAWLELKEGNWKLARSFARAALDKKLTKVQIQEMHEVLCFARAGEILEPVSGGSDP